MKHHLLATDVLSNVQALSFRAQYYVIGRGSVLIDELSLTMQEVRSIWPWVPGFKCLIIADVWKDPLGRKRTLFRGLLNSAKCIRLVETMVHTFFSCRVVVLLGRFIKDSMVRMLRRRISPRTHFCR